MTDNQSREVAVVDDDPAVLESFRFILELAGFEVRTYSSALAYLAVPDRTARCLILDQHMPAMTGLELARALRSNGSAVPMLLITAAPSPSITARASEIGISRVLEKPPAEEELIQFVLGCC